MTGFAKIALVLLALCGVLLAQGPGTAQSNPALPTRYSTAAPDTSSYKVIRVPAGGDLRDAIHRAACGTVIELRAGATYSGSFSLPNKNCAATSWIIIRSDVVDDKLPPSGVRYNPQAYDPGLLPKLVTTTNNTPVITTPPRTGFYRFIGVEFTHAAHIMQDLIAIDALQRASDEQPHDIIFDRCYVHGSDQHQTKHGILFNGRNLALVDSYVENIWIDGFQSIGVSSYNSTGPLLLRNNFIEALGENVLLGGATPLMPSSLISDVEITRNNLYKRPAWKTMRPSHSNACNHLEFKQGQRVLIDSNVMQYSWTGCGQAGESIKLNAECTTDARGEPKTPWFVTQDFTITKNVIQHVGSGISLDGHFIGTPACTTNNEYRTQRVLVANNVMQDINNRNWGGNGRAFEHLYGLKFITIDHNTFFHNVIYADYEGGREISTGYRLTNNVGPFGSYGLHCNTFPGYNAQCLAAAFPDGVFARNVFVNLQGSGGTPAQAVPNPAINYFPVDWSGVVADINNCNGGTFDILNCEVLSKFASKYKATDNVSAVGADIKAVRAATAGVSSSAGW